MMDFWRTFFLPFAQLSKPRLTQLVVLTALCGFGVAPGHKDYVLFIALLVGTTGIVAAANIVNCYLERDIDGLMERTRHRPLVTGQLRPLPVLWTALLIATLSIVILQRYTNDACAFLGFLGFILYIGVYTPLKRISMSALFLGAIPGAIPPVMGWMAVSPRIEPGVIAIFLILFFWQLPHFIAISVNRLEEYDNAGLKTVPGTYGPDWALRHMVFYSLLMVGTSFLPYAFGLAGAAYLWTSLLVGGFFFSLCVASIFNLRPLNWSRLIFFGTLIYLPVILGVWVFDQMITKV